MLPRKQDAHVEAREKALADGVRDVAAELRLVDVLDFIGYCRAGQHAILNDIVSSSVELFFKDGTLRYGWATDVDLSWQSTPSVMLDMEFHHQDIAVFFCLALKEATAAVDIRYIQCADGSGNAEVVTTRLGRAIADAQLPNPPGSIRPVRLRSAWFRSLPAIEFPKLLDGRP